MWPCSTTVRVCIFSCGSGQCDLHFAGANLGPGGLPGALQVDGGGACGSFCGISPVCGGKLQSSDRDSWHASHPQTPTPYSPRCELRCSRALDKTVNAIHMQMMILLKPQGDTLSHPLEVFAHPRSRQPNSGKSPSVH